MINWEKFATRMGHPTQVAILRMLDTEGVLSPKQIAERLKLPLGQVSYHVRGLVDKDVIKLVDTETRRGALEHFYSLDGRRRRNGNGAES